MLSPASAAALLAAATSLDALAPIAAAAGFSSLPLSLDPVVRSGLGLAELDDAVRLVPGAGTLRALLVECPPSMPIRAHVARIAQRLASRAPHLLWLLVAVEPATGEVAIATWSVASARPRVAALVVDRASVLPSDAHTLVALASVSEASDFLTHAFWIETLGREALTRRFYRTLERVVATLAREARGGASEETRQEIALLWVSRLLFLSFLESKGWLDGDRRFLEHRFAECMARRGRVHERLLLPLFFGTLNTPVGARARSARELGRIPFLNGGLFAPAPAERRARALRFRDESLGFVFGDLLARYRFTPREERGDWSEAAIDPEMLGKAFESLMSSRERRASGAYFTPHAMVERVTRAALVDALGRAPLDPSTVERALAGEPPEPPLASLLAARIDSLRVLDPACGSGAFLVHALETLAALRATLPGVAHAGPGSLVGALRREILTRGIFGVDVNPTAVWLCELRLWLSVVIESPERDPLRVTPLPNLDRHIRVGDALGGEAFGEALPTRGGATLARLRSRYARATGARKRTLERELDRVERAIALERLDAELARCAARRRDLLAALRGRDLFGDRVRPSTATLERLGQERTRSRELAAARRALRDGGALPFAWVTHFPDAARLGGFDVVVGNPPWVRLHRIPAGLRAALRARFSSFGDAAWTRGATLARAGAGFAAQVDLAALFLERSLTLLRDGGTLALILPAKMWRSLAGGGIRRIVRGTASIIAIEDWSESPAAFDAAVYPSLLVARRELPAPQRTAAAALHRRHGAIEWTIPLARLALGDDLAAPWLAVPPAVRDAFDRLARAGVPLAESALGAPQLGVKCGCNDAFVVRVEGEDGEVAQVRSDGRAGCVERALLRPILRGEGTVPWHSVASDERLVWTHDAQGAPLASLPPHAARWLERWRTRLAERADARGGTRWWSLFRVGAADGSRPRVVWADFGRAPRALVLRAGSAVVPLNSCYVLSCAEPADAAAFAALLNSPLAAAWLNVLAEPARGGYRRYLAWTVALLPVPRDWTRARRQLAALGERALAGEPVRAGELLAAALRAYRIRAESVAPLLAWNDR